MAFHDMRGGDRALPNMRNQLQVDSSLSFSIPTWSWSSVGNFARDDECLCVCALVG